MPSDICVTEVCCRKPTLKKHPRDTILKKMLFCQLLEPSLHQRWTLDNWNHLNNQQKLGVVWDETNHEHTTTRGSPSTKSWLHTWGGDENEFKSWTHNSFCHHWLTHYFFSLPSLPPHLPFLAYEIKKCESSKIRHSLAPSLHSTPGQREEVILGSITLPFHLLPLQQQIYKKKI